MEEFLCSHISWYLKLCQGTKSKCYCKGNTLPPQVSVTQLCLVSYLEMSLKISRKSEKDIRGAKIDGTKLVSLGHLG